MSARREPVEAESIRDAAALMLAVVTSDRDGIDAILDHCDLEQTVLAVAALGMMLTQSAAGLDDEATAGMLRTFAGRVAHITSKGAQS